MFSVLFDSISYPLLAFIFFIFVASMYYSNKRFNSHANKTYRVLLFFTVTTSLTLFFDFFGTSKVPVFRGLEPIFARLYILSTMLWASTYSYYLITSLMIKDQSIKNLRIIKYLLYGFNILLFIWSCFLELEYYHRTIYAIGGKALIPLYVEFAVTGTIYILCMILKHKSMNKTQFIMHSTILFILIAMTLLRFFTSWDVNYFTYIICIIPIALYFSSESSSYLLSLELDKSKKEYEKSNIEQNQKIQNISYQLTESLSNIEYSKQLINDNQLSQTDFYNEKINVYNETKKIYDIILETSQSESEVPKQ